MFDRSILHPHSEWNRFILKRKYPSMFDRSRARSLHPARSLFLSASLPRACQNVDIFESPNSRRVERTTQRVAQSLLKFMNGHFYPSLSREQVSYQLLIINPLSLKSLLRRLRGKLSEPGLISRYGNNVSHYACTHTHAHTWSYTHVYTWTRTRPQEDFTLKWTSGIECMLYEDNCHSLTKLRWKCDNSFLIAALAKTFLHCEIYSLPS